MTMNDLHNDCERQISPHNIYYRSEARAPGLWNPKVGAQINRRKSHPNIFNLKFFEYPIRKKDMICVLLHHSDRELYKGIGKGLVKLFSKDLRQLYTVMVRIVTKRSG
jgi:hypothetical protein